MYIYIYIHVSVYVSIFTSVLQVYNNEFSIINPTQPSYSPAVTVKLSRLLCKLTDRVSQPSYSPVKDVYKMPAVGVCFCTRNLYLCQRDPCKRDLFLYQTLPRTATHCCTLTSSRDVAACCSVWRWVVVGCSVLQWVAVGCSDLIYENTSYIHVRCQH